MKPTHLTIDTSMPPTLPHYTLVTTSTTSQTLFHRRKTLVTILTMATLSTIALLYFYPQSTTLFSHITITRSTSRTFTPNPLYNDLSPAANGNWTNLLPPNGGFFSQQTARKGDGEYEMVGMTMFHQLHCLSMIRGALQEQRGEIEVLLAKEKGEVGARSDRRRSEEGGDLFGVRRKRDADGEDLFGVRRKRNAKSKEGDLFGVRRKKRGEESHSEEREREHYLHCFDYLVQTILCNADATLEPAHETKDGGRAVDGYDVQHQCKNADAVWARAMGANSVPGWKLNTQDAREPEFDMMERRYS